jgi:hypothetical protein
VAIVTHADAECLGRAFRDKRNGRRAMSHCVRDKFADDDFGF